MAEIITDFGEFRLSLKEYNEMRDKIRKLEEDNDDVVCGIYCIVGYLCALLFMPSLKVAMFIWGLCCAIDNIGWLVVYHRNREKFIETDKDQGI